ncbi:MAG TPA: O-antigen ligase family protein [Ktedonobacteraceae bacterium]|nr:O-antigen ligase family protein [Ktedonobacteraceae bacterium]
MTLIIYLVLNLALAYLMTINLALGLLGAVAINAVVFLFLRSRFALPLYIIVAGPSLSITLSQSGILSRLYIGNMLLALLAIIWLAQFVLPERKSGSKLLSRGLLIPLLLINIVGLISIIYSRIYPDPNVPYTYPHSNVSITIVNLSEMALLLGLPLLLIIARKMVRTVRDYKLAFRAFIVAGVLYTLGTIFAAPLGFYSKKVILGVRRVEVFGLDSSGLGTTLVLFTDLAFGQALYSEGRRRLGWGLLTLLFAIGVILAFGREAWLELFMSMLVMLVFRTKNWAALLFLLLPIALLFVPGVSDFFNSSKVYGSDRLKIWADAITIWLKSPYFGIGAGNYQFYDWIYGVDKAGLAHNQYLEVLAEMGVQGLIALLWMLASFGVIAFKSFKGAKTRLSKSLTISFVGFYLCFIFGGFFTGILIPSAAAGGGTAGLIVASYHWLFLGLVITIPNWEKEAIQEEQLLSPPQLDTLSPLNKVVVSHAE